MTKWYLLFFLFLIFQNCYAEKISSKTHMQAYKASVKLLAINNALKARFLSQMNNLLLLEVEEKGREVHKEGLDLLACTHMPDKTVSTVSISSASVNLPDYENQVLQKVSSASSTSGSQQINSQNISLNKLNRFNKCLLSIKPYYCRPGQELRFSFMSGPVDKTNLIFVSNQPLYQKHPTMEGKLIAPGSADAFVAFGQWPTTPSMDCRKNKSCKLQCRGPTYCRPTYGSTHEGVPITDSHPAGRVYVIVKCFDNQWHKPDKIALHVSWPQYNGACIVDGLPGISKSQSNHRNVNNQQSLPRSSNPNCGYSLGDASYCAWCGPCDEGEYYCNKDLQCKSGLKCINNVCVKPMKLSDSGWKCPFTPDHPQFCMTCGPCEVGYKCQFGKDCKSGHCDNKGDNPTFRCLP